MIKIWWSFFKTASFITIFFTFSCSGGGSGGDYNKISSTITISKYNVTPYIISKSNPQSIQFTWEVIMDDDINSEYYMDIYISTDESIDDNDVLLAQINTKNANGNFTLETQTHSYEELLDLYCGQYYIIFYAHNDSGNFNKKYIPNFILKSKWSVIIYIDGDNSLSHEVRDDLNDISRVGSTNDVSIIVQVDTKSDTVKRYFIKPDELELLSDLGELNMADPNTLSDFLCWSTDKYMADHYLVILWDHGKGFKRKSIIRRNIFWDETSNSTSMSIPELANSLISLQEKINKKIDIIGFDACLMNMLEIVYEIKDSSDFVVGSENTEPFEGWPYEDILKYLIENVDTINSRDLSKKIVELYINYYNSSDEATLSTIDTSQIDVLKDRVNELAVNLIEGLKNDTNGILKNSLKTAILNNVQRFDDGYSYGISRYDDSYVDLYHLCYLIKTNLSTYKNCALNVIDALTSVIIFSQNTGGSVSNAHGLSIWLPDSIIYSLSDWKYYQQQYNELLFALDTQWDEFLTILWKLK